MVNIKSARAQPYTPDGVTVFTFAWASQSLAHLAYFDHWISSVNPLAWILLVLGLAVFLFPGRLRIFMAMLIADMTYFISEWPFVSNHILVSTFIGLTVLGAAVSVCRTRCFTIAPVTEEERNEIFSRFAPVLGAIFVFMYYAIIVSKFNEAFFDFEISCMTMMYSTFAVNNPLGTIIAQNFDTGFLFWLFIVIEVALPLLLTFRRTRLLAVYIGLPFHVLLGLMHHWSYSTMMIALYLVIAMPAFLELIGQIVQWLGRRRTAAIVWSFRGYVAITLLAVAWSALTGTYGEQAPFGLSFNFWIYQWLIWATVLSAGIILAALRSHALYGPFNAASATLFWTWQPKWLWLIFFLAVLNSSSPYTGFKTQTSAAMYSNMRTEGGMNNHFFMPTLRLFNFTDDLVEVLDSNDLTIKALRSTSARYDPYNNQYDILVTAFELRRAIAGVQSANLEITYKRHGEIRQFKRGATTNPDPDLDQPPPWWLAKVVYFRPVFKGDRAYCLH
jgi:hypothetical protein